VKVALAANRSNDISYMKVLDCRPQPNDLGSAVGAWDALFSDRDRVLLNQHSDITVVERYGVDLDDHIVGPEVLLLRERFLAFLKSERVLTRGTVFACAATVGCVGRWVRHGCKWVW
jgi:hypothetical protein